MKNVFFTLLTLFALGTNLNGQAESYGAFEWDILRLGYAIPGGVDGVGSGLALGSEARYNLKDNLSLGLRWEIAVYGSSDDAGDNFDIGAAGSYALMGDYYFNTESSRRAFAGFGVGLFSGASVEANGQTVDGDAGNAFGVVPRIGYELGHVRFSAEYNLTFSSNVANYIGVHIGFTLFGGYKG